MPFLNRIPAHELIEDGQLLPVLGGLRVPHTLGHTPGSVCLYLEQEQVLFTGGTLLADGFLFRRPVLFPGTSLREYRASLGQLSELPFEIASVGHGKHLGQEGSAALTAMLNSYSWFAPKVSAAKR